MIHLAPGTSGTYILVIQIPFSVDTEVGMLGKIAFSSGVYAYVGSAFGPGGLAARIGRFIAGPKRKHWHIDYLLEHSEVVAALHRADEKRRECTWADWMRKKTAGSISRFGSSDCRCKSHLFFVGNNEKGEEMVRVAGCELKATVRSEVDSGL